MPTWNSRFKKSLDEKALKFSSSIDIDGKLYNEDIVGSIAHVKMLMKQKIISYAEGKKIISALESIRKEILSGKLKYDWCNEDIHSFIEEQITKKIGAIGKKLHTARSRNDQVAIDERLYLKKEIATLIKALIGLQKSLLKISSKHKSTIMPGYTHLQRAQPILFAHHLLAYISMLERDVERLNDCLKRADKSPLGAAALSGTTLPIDRNYTAKLLGMKGIVENSLDAVSSRDIVIEFISTCAIIMVNLSRLAEELVLWSSQEFAFAQFDDSFATGSSLMPQKKNPDIAELVRGKTGRVYGALIGILTVMKSLPLAYNRDMQEDKFHLTEAVNTTKDCLEIMAGLLKHTSFRKDRFEKELDGDLSLSTELVDYLVRKEIPFREAHNNVGKVVALAVSKKKKLNEILLADYKKISPKFEKNLYNFLTAKSSINNRLSDGSTSPKEVDKQLKFWMRKLS
ncbi:MAG: argininosuccinate lyase [Melioribacteraceae bacterium]|nr:argininosuccinate lyase [Melioribacteraceae bacterium]